MKKRILLLLVVCTAGFISAQEEPEVPEQAEKPQEKKPEYGWKKEMVGSLNLTQTSFDNWSQGGENSTAWQLNLVFQFVQDLAGTNWSNSGKFTYGETKTGGAPSRKSIDEIKLESVYTLKIAKYINPFVAATGETQFAPGYDYGKTPKQKLSAFWDPVYFRESIGVGYKPVEAFQTRLGGALKQTLTRDYPVPYSDDPTTEKFEKVKSEIGIESVSDLNVALSKTTGLKSKLELFSALEGIKKVDVNWDTLISAKISKYISVNFNLKLFYDSDISTKRQIKQSLALGLSYNFL